MHVNLCENMKMIPKFNVYLVINFYLVGCKGLYVDFNVSFYYSYAIDNTNVMKHIQNNQVSIEMPRKNVLLLLLT